MRASTWSKVNDGEKIYLRLGYARDLFERKTHVLSYETNYVDM